MTENQNDFLKPCPFCGRSVILFTSIHGILGAKDYYAITHPDVDTDCIIEETASYIDKEKLIQDWNRRVSE